MVYTCFHSIGTSKLIHIHDHLWLATTTLTQFLDHNTRLKNRRRTALQGHDGAIKQSVAFFVLGLKTFGLHLHGQSLLTFRPCLTSPISPLHPPRHPTIRNAWRPPPVQIKYYCCYQPPFQRWNASVSGEVFQIFPLLAENNRNFFLKIESFLEIFAFDSARTKLCWCYASFFISKKHQNFKQKYGACFWFFEVLTIPSLRDVGEERLTRPPILEPPKYTKILFCLPNK
jgi:hypothetical protein